MCSQGDGTTRGDKTETSKSVHHESIESWNGKSRRGRSQGNQRFHAFDKSTSWFVKLKMFKNYKYFEEVLKECCFKFKAKNSELEHLHEVASKRLEELKLAKQTLVDLKHTNKKQKRRDKVEVIMEETEQNSAPQLIVAEEN